MNFTGERWVFNEGGDDLIQREHMARYDFACKYVKGKRVLDIACGVGYGSFLLKSKGKALSVVGADIDADSIKDAASKYGDKWLTFVEGDAQRMPFDDDSFDIVVSFETIEHLFDQSSYLAEVFRVLGSKGLFIVSTPDRDSYRLYNLGKPNKFHTKELSQNEFYNELLNWFPSVKLFAQNKIEAEVWIRAMKKAPLSRLLRMVDVFQLRKVAKKLINANLKPGHATVGSATIYDALDPTVRPVSKGNTYVYLTAVCRKDKS